jgi:hypothetical protein
LAPKQLQLLRELIPNAARFGVLADPAVPVTPSIIADLQAAARTLGLQLVVANARTDSDLEKAFATFSQQHVGAILVSSGGSYFTRHAEQLAALAARHALPAIFPYRENAVAGGLMSYGTSFGYAWHQVGNYTGRILKGDKPADLPVEQVTKLELVINLKTAKASASPSRKRCWRPPTRLSNDAAAAVHRRARGRGGMAARGAHNRPSACGGSASSSRATKMIPCRSLASLRSSQRHRASPSWR